MTGNRPLALVTGASSGIGTALARELARHGHDLVLTARRTAPMEALAAELRVQGAAVTVIAADLGKPGAAASLAAELGRRQLVVDVLVNNAGLGAGGPFHESDPARVADILQVNVVALTELTRALLPGMVGRASGRVLFVASTASFQPGPSMAVYCASKAYVLSFGEAIGYELRGTGVTVTTLCPGPTHTEFTDGANTGKSKLFTGPMANVMSSDEVARQGYRALAAGKRVHVVGLSNKLVVFSGRFSPRALSLPVTSAILKPGK
ncbi:MAG: SDR family NAD(P)-dependent oxidoreductase [Gemmatimonadales bacterium]